MGIKKYNRSNQGYEELMEVGQKAHCKTCGREIEWTGTYWDHVGKMKPRHIAIPNRFNAQKGPNMSDAIQELSNLAGEVCSCTHGTDPGTCNSCKAEKEYNRLYEQAERALESILNPQPRKQAE
jgi:hypothetical protein